MKITGSILRRTLCVVGCFAIWCIVLLTDLSSAKTNIGFIMGGVLLAAGMTVAEFKKIIGRIVGFGK